MKSAGAFQPLSAVKLLLISCVALPFTNGELYASSSNTKYTSSNATLSTRWSRQGGGAGVFSDGLVMLYKASVHIPPPIGTSGNTSYGIFLKFNESDAVVTSEQPSPAPFFAYISCDANTTAVVNQTLNSTTPASPVSPPVSLNGTTTNNTLPTGTTISVNTTTMMDAVHIAASLNATAVVLYSLLNQSCELNQGYLSNDNETNPSISIYTTTSLYSTNLLLSQLSDVPVSQASLNTTQISVIASSVALTFSSINITQLLSTGYLIASLVVTPSSENSTAGAVASIGPASSSSPSPSPSLSTTSGVSSPAPSTSLGGSPGSTGSSSSGGGSSHRGTAVSFFSFLAVPLYFIFIA